MRILFWAQDYRPSIGGVEVLLGALATRLADDGHDVAVMTTTHHDDLPPRAVRDGVTVHRFRLRQAVQARDLALMTGRTAKSGGAQEILPARPDTYPPDGSRHFFSSEDRARLALSPRDNGPCRPAIRGTRGDTALRRGFARAARIVAVSKALRDEVVAISPATADRIAVIYNGLPAPAIDPAPLDVTTPSLLCIGRLADDKGFDTAIDALPDILSRHSDTGLIIAGSGPSRNGLETRAATLGVGGAVDFLGPVEPSRVPDLINAATLVLVPSRWREAFGLVALQAAQMARPVVASNSAGLAEVVADGETGLLVPKDDPSRLADAACRLLSDPDFAQRLGDTARRRASRKFDFDSFLRSHYQTYADILRQRR